MVQIDGPVTIERYAAQRRYDTRAARYPALLGFAKMAQADHNSIVTDATSGDDVTRSVLKQIIVERKRHG